MCWCAAAFLLLLLVVPLVFQAPEAPAAREARRPHCVRRRASKPARALRSLRRPPHQWGWVADVLSCASSRSPAWSCHRPRAPRQVPPQAPQVSCLALACRIAESTPNFARNSPKVLSNREIRSLEFQRFGALLNVQAIELHATVLGVWSYALVMSHAIPSGVFHGVRPDRWNSADYAVVLAGVGLKLHAELRCEVALPWLSLLLRGIALHRWAMHYIRRRCTASLLVHCCAIWCIASVSSASLRCGETGGAFATLCERWLDTGGTFARGQWWFSGC